MPDIEATIGLDARQFHAGLNSVEKSTKQIATMFAGRLGMDALRRGFAFGREALQEYAETSIDAQRDVAALSSVFGELKASIGQDLAAAFVSASGEARGLLSQLDELRRSAVDLAAAPLREMIFGDTPGESLADLNAARAADEASRRSMTATMAEARARGGAAAADDARRRRGDLEFELSIQRDSIALEAMKRAGNEEDAAQIKARLDVAKQIRDVQRDESLSMNDRIRLEQEIRSVAEARGAEAVQSIRQQTKAQADAFRSGFADQWQATESTIQALSGYEELARWTDIRLQAEQRIAAVREQAGLSDAEKARMVNGLLEQRNTLLEATVAKDAKTAQEAAGGPKNYVVSEAGKGFATGLAAISRAGGGKDEKTAKLIQLQEQANRFLQQIGASVKDGVPAVAG